MDAYANLLSAAQALTRRGTTADALSAILGALRGLTPLDVAAVLTSDRQGRLAVAAQWGLAPSAGRVRFEPDRHARLRHALCAPGPLRFDDPAESDPYDGLLLGRNAPIPSIHACMVAPLRIGQRTVGLLTLDALDPRGLDGVSNEQVVFFAALASAALQKGPPTAGPRGEGGPTEASTIVWGRSRAMQRLRLEIEELAQLALPVLIVGETGVGKDLVARALHAGSRRAAQPLVTLNCAAVPASLSEAELFGHTGGAFTGAIRARSGRFGAADGGTLFLDEIGELPPGVQAALLRALEGKIQRVGDELERRIDVRILAATNRDLGAEVAQGRFRQDLYHRLWVYPLQVPPLRDHPEDIPALIEHFGAAFAAQLGYAFSEVDERTLDRWMSAPWPGNIRQLKNTVERALLRAHVGRLSEGRAREALSLRAEDLEEVPAPVPVPAPVDDPVNDPGAPVPLSQALEEVRLRAMTEALAQSQGNVAQAARLLGLSRSFAYKEAVRLGLIRRGRR